MSTSKKKLCVALALAVVLTVSLAQMPKAYSAELTVQEKAISAIKDVVGLDMTKYSVELSSYFSDRPDDYGGLLRENIMYTLESGRSKMEFSFRFVNGILWFVDINPYNSSLLSAYYAKQLPISILDATKVILQRLQTYSGASYIQPMRNSMDAVTDINSVNATIGNLKRLVTVNTNVVSHNTTSTSISIYFMYTINGADSPKSVNVHFRDGALTGFGDGWGLFKIGSESIKISREEAISIAREQANNATTATLNFGNRPLRADLHMFPREPFTLYPFWFVELPLDYPNSTITGWQVGIWADTGKIAYSHPTGILGNSPNAENPLTVPIPTAPPTSPDTKPESENNENSPLNTYLIAVTVSIITVVAIATIVLKKRTK
ncbi:MAG: hypothetical protein QXU99_06510 [Candidatus Bathyarchaeia archaeon]